MEKEEIEGLLKDTSNTKNIKEVRSTNQLDYDYELQIQQLEILKIRADVERQEKELRKFSARLVIETMVIWLIFTMIVIGYYAFAPSKGLSDNVLCALLGTTAIVSLANTVLKGLFGRKK